MGHQSWDGAGTVTTRKASERAYAEAGISNPRADISLTEVHDCFSITELVLMEDLWLSDDGKAPMIFWMADLMRQVTFPVRLMAVLNVSVIPSAHQDCA